MGVYRCGPVPHVFNGPWVSENVSKGTSLGSASEPTAYANQRIRSATSYATFLSDRRRL